MGFKNLKTGEVIKENKKSSTHGYVKEIVVEQNDEGQNELHFNIEMNDL